MQQSLPYRHIGFCPALHGFTSLIRPRPRPQHRTGYFQTNRLRRFLAKKPRNREALAASIASCCIKRK
ncbi:unnamed protein product [Cercospora beticola]|nr:unnamed protein product [Cercospora beticola]